jgi:hypothetical protein
MRPHIITGTCTGVIEPSSSVTHSAWHVEPPLLRSMILSKFLPEKKSYARECVRADRAAEALPM